MCLAVLDFGTETAQVLLASDSDNDSRLVLFCKTCFFLLPRLYGCTNLLANSQQ